MSLEDIQADLELEAKNTAVIVVDMENDFVAEGAPLETPMGRAFVDELNTFLTECRDAGSQIVYTTHVHRESGCDMGTMADIWVPIEQQAGLVDETEGVEIYDPISPEEDDILIKKHRYSGFYGTDLDIILRNSGIENVVITGVTTENCCAMTARAAQFRDYDVVFLADLTGTFDYPDQGYGERSAQEIHETVCTIMGTSVGTLATADDVLETFGRRAVASDD
ncbi:cysteine hydrolase [Natrarchaeobius halalkaliphilus]|uniref:Cysteine hydrolase n=1 Tax=Natrarchaeobius halalkaliphilus TaxID=1679091 RepID=A0A3N6P0C7_9EURY|nr:isochorismatase family cysteine hydrolase [Natrarchaeobius halalkaliphilus]RQG87898.1 cysteine hydrolase [Natrarchaeobius halalkaliphilus]